MNCRFFLIGVLLMGFAQVSFASIPLDKRKVVPANDSIKIGVDYLKYFLENSAGWEAVNPELGKSLEGLVHYIEDEEIDTIVNKLNLYRTVQSGYFQRTVDRVADSLQVPGYIPQAVLDEKLKRIDRSVRGSIIKEQIAVPEQLFGGLDRKVKLISSENADRLMNTSLVKMPDSLQMLDAIPDSLINNPNDFKRIQRLDSMRRDILEQARLQYNNRILANYIDSVSESYRDMYITEYSKKVQREFADSIRAQNQLLLQHYNDSIMNEVNSSVDNIVRLLTARAHQDSTLLRVYNTGNDSTLLWLRNDEPDFTRLFIKNAQNDSLSVKIVNVGKNAMQLLIDDAVTFSRLAEKQKKEFKFQGLQLDGKLRKVEKRYDVVTPWVLGGDGTVGFTQTYLSNWKKGGKSALSTLIVMKGFANYSYKKIKWENSAEIRNGWMKSSDDKIQKNDDKFELTSRFGLSAFKKWYYSSEIDFETQLFNGYNYPDRETLISGFLSPSKTLFKLGLDYKPNNNFSLFLSPLTAKTVFVRDTARIDESKYGIEPGKRRYWEPGLNADVKYKYNVSTGITYEMKYKMFINYRNPFSSFDVDFENNLVMQLNDHINMRVLLHFVYDDNVTFPTSKVDLEGNTIYKPKWQMKEFITIGFSYKLNKRIYRREQLN